MNKKGFVPFLPIILVLIAVGGIVYMSSNDTLSVFSETYNLYDDFSNIDNTKWTYHYDGHDGEFFDGELDAVKLASNDDGFIGVKDGYSYLSVRHISLEPYSPRTTWETEMISKKKFETENLKLKLDNIYHDQLRTESGGCGSDVSPFLYYGDTKIVIPKGDNIGYGSGCGNAYTNKYQQKGILEIKRYDDLDLTKYVVIWKGEEVQTGRNTKPESIILGSNMRVDELRSKAYFSCSYDKNVEVVIRDKFSEGSMIHIGDEDNVRTLTYSPVRFCTEDLGVIIIDDEKGLTKEVGSITSNIADGKGIVVPQGQTYYVRYTTKYVNDMTERCEDLNKEYSTELKKCISTGVQQQIPTETLLYCEDNNDCIIPNNCKDATVACVNKQCDYANTQCSKEQIINYIEVLQTIELETPKISRLNDGKVEIQFSNDEVIMANGFYSTKPKVLIQNPEDGGDGVCYVPYNEYVTKKGCYSTNYYFGEYEGVIVEGSEIYLSDNMKLSYDMSGRGAFRGEKSIDTYHYEFVDDEDWANTFTLTLSDILTIRNVSFKEQYILNEDAYITFYFNSPIFDNINGGYYLNIKKESTNVYEDKKEYVDFEKEGELLKADIKVVDDTIGIYNVEVRPYVLLNDDTEYIFEKINFAYYVSTEQVLINTVDNSFSFNQIYLVGILILIFLIVFFRIFIKIIPPIFFYIIFLSLIIISFLVLRFLL